MKITKGQSGTALTVAVNGRIDTTTAPELEAVLGESLGGVEKLVLDLKELDYISSAGLRVLLSTQKKMNKQGEMIVKNVSESVNEVFEITGFSDILTIE
ncbi:MAG: STAS domain-containing protein [Clostridia bacterium]|nr:STAS domain-containing protein [Clostridia bacterium]